MPKQKSHSGMKSHDTPSRKVTARTIRAGTGVRVTLERAKGLTPELIVATLVVVGAAGYLNLGVDRFPAVDLPTVRIATRLPGASPAEMESQISQPIERKDDQRSIAGQANVLSTAIANTPPLNNHFFRPFPDWLISTS